MTAQELGRDRVKGAEPRHAFGDGACQQHDALAHFACCLVGEGHRQDFVRAGLARRDHVRDAGRQNAGLASTSAGEHQHGAIERLDRLALLGIERGEIGRRATGRSRARPGGNAAGLRRVIGFEGLAALVRRSRTRGGKAGQTRAPVRIATRIGLLPMWGFKSAMSPAVS